MESDLHPILDEDAAKKREFHRRRKDYHYRAVGPDQAAVLEAEGWAVDRRLRQRTRLKKAKSADERLENRVWTLFYKMQFSDLNAGRAFKIRFRRSGKVDGEKQIDVFAKDDQTVVIAECKAAKTLRRRSLQKDIEELANLQKPIANAIRKHYGTDYKPKLIWLLVTDNIMWSPEDIKRAKGENISRVTERELRYFSQLTDHLGPAARFQFQAEFLSGQKIPELDGRVVPAIRGRLGKHRFYSFVATPNTLLPIAFVNHRTLNDPDGVPTYQRLIQKSRLKKVSQFIKDGGYFPTNIILNFVDAVRFDVVRKDEETRVHHGLLYLPQRYKSAWVIDGQHRLYGYSTLEPTFLRENVPVLAFEKMPTEEEANLFVTINHEQKTVPRNLLDDLQGELKWGSGVPAERVKAISARLINILNADHGEPFFNRVAQQGLRATRDTCLTIPAMMDGLRRSGLVGRAMHRDKSYDIGILCGSTDNKTLDRARTALNLYFTQIRESNWDRWHAGTDGMICTNTSVQAHFRLIATLAEHLHHTTGQDPRELAPDELVEQLMPYVQPILGFTAHATADAFAAKFKVPYGSGGPIEYYYRLLELVHSYDKTFYPPDFREWKKNEARNIELNADTKVKQINILVGEGIVSKLKELHGEEGSAYWEKGIKDKAVKVRAYEKSQDDPPESRAPIESYLDFIDYKKIIERSDNWPQFKDLFDIPLPGDKGLAKNLRWMDRMNEIRRIPAHATLGRSYNKDDLDVVELVYDTLSNRIMIK